jgi:anti-anti-sigma factor
MSDASFPLRLSGGVPVVAAPEEIDITNAGLLRAALLAARPNGSRTVVVDMSGTHFCDSSGLNVLVRAHQRAQAGGGEVRLVVSGESVLRIFAVTGIDRVIPIFATLDDALSGPLARVPAPPVGLSAAGGSTGRPG